MIKDLKKADQADKATKYKRKYNPYGDAFRDTFPVDKII